MPYADPEKRKAAVARSNRKRREDPEVRAAENEARQLRRGEPKTGGHRQSVGKVLSLDDPAALRDLDALAFARWTESLAPLYEDVEGDSYTMREDYEDDSGPPD